MVKGNRDGNENEDGNGHGDRDKDGNQSGNGYENREKGGREGESGNLRSDNRSGSEDARGGATPTIDQQPQPQDLTPSETGASCVGPDPRDRRRGTGLGRVEGRRTLTKNTIRGIDAM